MPGTAIRLPQLAILAALTAASLMMPSFARAQEQQPPGCTEARWLKGIKTQYNSVEDMQPNGVKIKNLSGVKEIYYGSAPQSFNQYSNSNDRVTNVRWCQAELLLTDGQGDTIYWFLADELKGDKHSTVYDHCSDRHNLIDETCAKYREHR